MEPMTMEPMTMLKASAALFAITASSTGPRRHSQRQDGTVEGALSPEADAENPEANDFERSQEDMPTDDPGDAQHTSKSEPDGDGEEELR